MKFWDSSSGLKQVLVALLDAETQYLTPTTQGKRDFFQFMVQSIVAGSKAVQHGSPGGEELLRAWGTGSRKRGRREELGDTPVSPDSPSKSAENPHSPIIFESLC